MGRGHREWLGTPASSPAPAWDTVKFLMSPSYREMKQGGGVGRGDPVRCLRQREGVSEMWRDMGRPWKRGDHSL